MSVAKPSFLTVLTAHLRADARKTAVLALLAAVMVVVYARWFWSSSTPNSAQAAPAVAAATPVSESHAVNVAATPITGPARLVISRPVARDLKSDPFALNLERFPAGREEKLPTAAPSVEDPIEAAAKTLVLQSTVSGKAPMACINGVFLTPGQRVNGFVLEKVEPTRVVLGREGVKVELYLR